MFQRSLCCLLMMLWTLTMGLAGCSKSTSGPDTASSGGAPAQTQSASSGPCALITQAEVESALGKGATMTADTNPRTGMRECKLKLPNGTALESIGNGDTVD